VKFIQKNLVVYLINCAFTFYLEPGGRTDAVGRVAEPGA